MIINGSGAIDRLMYPHLVTLDIASTNNQGKDALELAREALL